MQRLGNLIRQIVGQSPLTVDGCQLREFGIRIGDKLSFFFLEVGTLDVDLRAHGNILAGRHGHDRG